MGLLLTVGVHAASIQDRDGAKQVLEKSKGDFPRLQLVWADGGYRGEPQRTPGRRSSCGRHCMISFPDSMAVTHPVALARSTIGARRPGSGPLGDHFARHAW